MLLKKILAFLGLGTATGLKKAATTTAVGGAGVATGATGRKGCSWLFHACLIDLIGEIVVALIIGGGVILLIEHVIWPWVLHLFGG